MDRAPTLATPPATPASAPGLARIDHVHVFVRDRAQAMAWYQRVMGLHPVPALAHWAADGGPLTIADAAGTLHLALFERPPQPCRSTIALAVDAPTFRAWQAWLGHQLGQPPVEEDHGLTVSLYFSDPDGNPYEITCWDVDALNVR